MKRMLFVDDEASILDGLRRLLRPRRAVWDMTFVVSGAEAIRLLEIQPFDVVVTDMRMPGFDGAAVLGAARTLHPGSVRLILSGNAVTDAALCATGVAHQFLAKPCDPATLEQVLTRILALRNILADPALRALVGDVGTLPSVPSTYLSLVEKLSDPEGTIQDVARIVERDTAVAAKILQLANSSYFGMSRRVTSLEQAVSHLGATTVRAVTLSNETVRLFRSTVGSPFDVDAFQSHSLRVGGLARRLLKRSSEGEDAFMAGILHDIGALVLATTPPPDDAWFPDPHHVGLGHAEVGGYLLGIWGLPHTIVEAVTLHHGPGRAGTTGVEALAAVHVADSLDHEHHGGVAQALDHGFLAAAGYADRLEDWRRIAEAFANTHPGEG